MYICNGAGPDLSTPSKMPNWCTGLLARTNGVNLNEMDTDSHQHVYEGCGLINGLQYIGNIVNVWDDIDKMEENFAAISNLGQACKEDLIIV